MQTTKVQISLGQCLYQLDQCLCCSLPRQYNTSSCYIRNFKTPMSRPVWVIPGRKPRRQVFWWHGWSPVAEISAAVITQEAQFGHGAEFQMKNCKKSKQFWHPKKLLYLSRHMTKPAILLVHPANTQISLGIHRVWSESSLSALRNIRPLTTYWAHCEDSDQTGQMPFF